MSNSLSRAHDAVSRVHRVFNGDGINPICNHPQVRPWLGGSGEIDVTPVLQNPNNIGLISGSFAVVCIAIQPGLYEVHSQALPDARGTDTLRAARAMQFWMFTRTPCLELVTRVPKGNEAARMLAITAGFRPEFERPDLQRPDRVLTEFFSLPLQAWAARADGLTERGHWFHEEITRVCAAAKVQRAPHPDDENHDRYAGMAAEMVLNGQAYKAAAYYNRWAALSGYAPIIVLSADPLVVHIGDMALRVTGQSFEIASAN